MAHPGTETYNLIGNSDTDKLSAPSVPWTSVLRPYSGIVCLPVQEVAKGGWSWRWEINSKSKLREGSNNPTGHTALVNHVFVFLC